MSGLSKRLTLRPGNASMDGLEYRLEMKRHPPWFCAEVASTSWAHLAAVGGDKLILNRANGC